MDGGVEEEQKDDIPTEVRDLLACCISVLHVIQR